MANQVGLPTRLAFGVGQFAEGLKAGAFNFFLLFYYNQVLGLPGSWSGAALLVAMSVDAVTDPLVGSLSDRHRSRFGRRHPFMYGAALPFAATFYLLFAPPSGLGNLELFLWLAVFSSLARTAMTFYSVPHMSLGAELTHDYRERTTLSSIRAGFGLLGSIAVIAVGFAAFFAPGDGFENGQLNPAAYPPFALACGVAMVITIWLSAAGTHRAIPSLPKAAEDAPPFRLASIFSDYRSALQLPPFRSLFSSLVSNYIVQGLLHTLSLYILTFFWKLSGDSISLLMLSGFSSMLIGAAIAGPVSHWLGEKRKTAMLAMGWWAICTSTMVTLQLFGWAPPLDSPLLIPLIFTGSFLGGLGNGVFVALGASMIADVTDEHEERYGARQEGIYYGSISFAAKAASGIGTLLSGTAIDAVGLGAQADPASVAPAVVAGLGWVYGPGVILLMAVPILLLRSYPIDPDRHARTLRALGRDSA